MGNYDFKKQPSLLIQGAMDTETAYFIEHLEEHECVTIGNWQFHTGFLGAKREPVIISKTFQGMVNAAAATSLALAYFKPWAVINQGIGGGHDKNFTEGTLCLEKRSFRWEQSHMHFLRRERELMEKVFHCFRWKFFTAKRERQKSDRVSV